MVSISHAAGPRHRISAKETAAVARQEQVRSAQEQGLLTTVLAEPDNDDPRLVYADWLDEHDQPARAEFIRLQIELARLRGGKRKEKQRLREKELLDAHKDTWAEPVAEFRTSYTAYHSRTLYVFRRGFVEGILTDPDTFIEQAEEMFARAPIREVRFAEVGDYEELAKCKHLLRLHTLEFAGTNLTEEDNPGALLRCRYLANLTRLAVEGVDDNGHLDLVGVRALVGSKYLGKLEALSLKGNWLNEYGSHRTVAYFLEKANLPALRELDLSWACLDDVDAEALAATPWVGRLRVLNLWHNSIGDRGARALVESPHLAKIELLDLRENLRTGYGMSEPISPRTKAALKKRFGKRVLQTPQAGKE
jgi:uncharacterized protein (TIGR02996 family)